MPHPHIVTIHSVCKISEEQGSFFAAQLLRYYLLIDAYSNHCVSSFSRSSAIVDVPCAIEFECRATLGAYAASSSSITSYVRRWWHYIGLLFWKGLTDKSKEHIKLIDCIVIKDYLSTQTIVNRNELLNLHDGLRPSVHIQKDCFDLMWYSAHAYQA